MTTHVLLDNVTHKNLKIHRLLKPGCGFDFNVARIFPIELSLAQRDYPLFFVKNKDSGDFETIALLGFSEGENLYLGDNSWDADYFPLSVERQPFLIGFQEQTKNGVPNNVPVVHIDMDHPSISSEEGVPVFLPQGGESPYLERINSVLRTIHEGHAEAQDLSQVLEGLELIESLNLTIEFKDESKQTLAGLFTINEERFRSLSGDALATLNTGRHLQHIFMMLASLPGLERLIERKNKRLVPA